MKAALLEAYRAPSRGPDPADEGDAQDGRPARRGRAGRTASSRSCRPCGPRTARRSARPSAPDARRSPPTRRSSTSRSCTGGCRRTRTGRWVAPARSSSGRSRESLNVGAYDDGVQVGYARVVDRPGDVRLGLRRVRRPVAAGCRDRQQARSASVLAELSPLGLQRVMLATADAHALYAAHGFEPLPNASMIMVAERQPDAADAGRPRPLVISRHGSDPEARSGRLCRQQRRAQDVVRRPGRSPPDAAHADRRGHAARGLPLPPGRQGPRAGRPGAAGDAARRAGALLRPAPRLLAGRALRRRRPADVPRGVRRGLLQATATSAWSTGSTRSCPAAIREVVRARRRASGARGRLEPRRDLRAAHRRRPPGPADRVADRRSARRSTSSRCRWSRRSGRCSTSPTGTRAGHAGLPG